MNRTKVSKSQNETKRTRVKGEATFLRQLSAIWTPFQRQGLEVRFKMGKLLNEKLGPPKARQQFGLGTIQRISEKLGIARSEISRMRRFAAIAETLHEFRKNHSELKTWTQVREMLAMRDNKPTPPNDSRVSSGVLRSAKSMVQAFERQDYQFNGSTSDEELVKVLRRLFSLAQTNLNMTLKDK